MLLTLFSAMRKFKLPAVTRTVVEVGAVGTGGDARVGALVEVEARPARGALVATATDTGVAQRGALLAAFPIVTEKAAGAFGHTHPDGRG